MYIVKTEKCHNCTNLKLINDLCKHFYVIQFRETAYCSYSDVNDK